MTSDDICIGPKIPVGNSIAVSDHHSGLLDLFLSSQFVFVRGPPVAVN